MQKSNLQDNFYCINLSDFFNAEGGEEFIKEKINNFSSINEDVEDFLKNSAIQAEKLRTSSTYFILNKKAFLGYFTLAIKILNFPKTKVSSKVKRIISRFGILNLQTNCYEIPAVLIAQLSKNYSINDNQLDGNTLISLIFNKIKEIFKLAGGKTIFLECEKIEKLLLFYKQNGFESLETIKLSKHNKELLQLYRMI